MCIIVTSRICKFIEFINVLYKVYEKYVYNNHTLQNIYIIYKMVD